MELSPILQIIAALQFGLAAVLFLAVWARGGFKGGPQWRAHRKDGAWVMRREIDGKIETRPATEAEADSAQNEADYEWRATR